MEKNLSKQLIHLKLEKHCRKSVKVFTDDYTIYNNLENHKKVKKHHIINHSTGKYADGENHVNKR